MAINIEFSIITILDRLESKLDNLEAKVDELGSQLNHLSDKVNQFQINVNTPEQKNNKVNKRISKLDFIERILWIGIVLGCLLVFTRFLFPSVFL